MFKLSIVTFTFEYLGDNYTVMRNVSLSQWTVAINGAPFITIPSLQIGEPINDDTALRILKRALKID